MKRKEEFLFYKSLYFSINERLLALYEAGFRELPLDLIEMSF